MPCRLILNADDFGWSEGVNEAVCRLYDEGIVTSASLMVGAPAFQDAVRRLESRPGLAVGLHVAGCLSPAVLPHGKVPHITGRDGWLERSHLRAGLRYSVSSTCRRELHAEIEAQFRRFADLGLGWSHLDTHVHLALTPAFLRAVLECARPYPVTGFRVPDDDFALYCRLEPRDALRQVALAAGFAVLCPGVRRTLAAGKVGAESRRFRTTRCCYGVYRSGRLTPEYLVRLVHALPDGDLELHCHPDLDSAAGRVELNALTSGAFRRALAERGVVLSTYSALAGVRQP